MLVVGFASAKASLETSNYLAFESRIKEIYKEKKESVVQVFAAMDKPQKDDQALLFVGTGFFISKEGHILTNASITHKADRVWIEYKNTAFASDVVGEDVSTNLSIIKLSEPFANPPPFFKLGTAETLPEPGTFLLAITRELGMRPGPTLGMVSGHNITYGKRLLPAVYLKSNIASDGGEGGSPVFDLHGNLAGIMIAALPEIRSSFILPSKAVKRVVDEIIFSGEVRYAWFGVKAHQVYDQKNDETRIVIDYVVPDSPAAQAGMKTGDILLKIGDYQLRSDHDLRNASFYTPAEQRVTVVVKRGKETLEIPMKAGVREPLPDSPEPVDALKSGEKADTPEAANPENPTAINVKTSPQTAPGTDSKEPQAQTGQSGDKP